MDVTRRRMIAVALAVCAFAVGMAALLNVFKYQATAVSIIEQRLSFTGRSIESSIQSSLSVGLQFADLSTLQALLERERATDALILSIDVFDPQGRTLYSTDQQRLARPAPSSWLAAARKASTGDWSAHAGDESALGLPVQNNFGLTLGHLALRYTNAPIRQATWQMARELMFNAGVIFAIAATLASLALLAVMRRLERDMQRMQAALDPRDAQMPSAPTLTRGPFAPALKAFHQVVRQAEADVALARADLRRDAGS